MIVTGTHNPYLVAFSILVAVFASYTALDLGGHVAATRGLARHVAGGGRDHNGRRNMVNALRCHARLRHAHTDIL